MKEEMNINLNNYEAWFLDYHEGNLSPDLVKELMKFIAKHPELKEEFESFEPVILQAGDKIKYDAKEALKKQGSNISHSNFDEYAIEYVEGTLPAASQKKLEEFIAQNPTYKKELELYAKTKLVADATIVFDDKLSLKKGARRPAAIYYWSAAASVAVIVVAYFMLNKSGTPNGNSIVQHNQIKDSNEVVKHIVKSVDTNPVIPKIAPNTPVNKAVKNNAVVGINKHIQKQHKHEIVLPQQQKMTRDSSAMAVNKGTDNNIVPVKKQNPAPLNYRNDSVAINKNLPDKASIGVPLIKKDIGNAPLPVVAKAGTLSKKKRGKFLILLATLTCKGLHKVTGQHIELEKLYGGDTITIVAYQLDLGNKKIDVPVKE